MKKNISLGLIIISIIFLVSCGITDKLGESSPKQTKDEQKNNINGELKKDLIKQNLKSKSEIEKIFKEGGQIKCNLKINEEGTKVEGIIYIDNKKMKADFKSESKEGMKFEGHTLTTSGYSYTWNNQTTSGIKMKFNEEGLLGLDKESSTGSTNEEKFDCVEGIKGTDFTIPSNIQFQEINPQDIKVPQPQK